jgi:C_GCAxxG_C_C family probable redox protein
LRQPLESGHRFGIHLIGRPGESGCRDVAEYFNVFYLKSWQKVEYKPKISPGRSIHGKSQKGKGPALNSITDREKNMIISEPYRQLSLPQLLDKAFELGVAYEKYSGSCSQCTVAALQEILGFEDVIVKVSTSSCGGQAGLSCSACGGMIGGTIVLDYYLGRPAHMVSATESVPDGLNELERAMEVARNLSDKFIRQYGSILCPQVQTSLFGRSFNLRDPEDWKAFQDAGAHEDPSKCMSVVGNAVRWTLEILIEKGVVTL